MRLIDADKLERDLESLKQDYEDEGCDSKRIDGIDDCIEEIGYTEPIKQEPCEDCIDRQAAIAHAVPLNLFGREVMMVSVSELENLPSAQPEPSIPLSWIEKPVIHAHWIPCENETGEGSNTYKCSACGEIQMLIDGTPKDNGWAYCPHCGAKMDKKIVSDEDEAK